MGKFVIKTTKSGGYKFDLKAGNGETIATSEIYTDKSGEFRFRLKATNGEIIAVSEGYKALTSCKNGIESVKKNAPEAEVKMEEA